MQADVQRNVNQEQRIEAGVKNGSLTNHEVAKLERGQARIDAKEAVAGHDGHVSAAEQARVQRTENRQSRRIHRQKNTTPNNAAELRSRCTPQIWCGRFRTAIRLTEKPHQATGGVFLFADREKNGCRPIVAIVVGKKHRGWAAIRVE
ncbi:hypothetical protein ACFS07_26630 [Undibacterium arcticum]